MSGTSDAEVLRRALDEARRAHAAATKALGSAERAAAAVGVDDAAGDETITAQRINIVEPDGTLRLVVTNAAQFPGMIIRGHEYEHPGRIAAAGLVFFNDEATETGGLIFAGAANPAGHSSGVHLSYDNFEQDQVVVLASSDDGPKERMARLEFVDRPDWSILDLVKPTQGDDTESGASSSDHLSHGDQPARRMRLAREVDGSVALTLCDAAGQPRIVLHVDGDGEAAIRVLDANGEVVGRLPG